MSEHASPGVIETKKQFDIQSYLVARSQNPQLCMVELGHDSLPVAYKQLGGFYGERRYLGCEPWLRDPLGIKKDQVEKWHQEKSAGQNIFYFPVDLSGRIVRDLKDKDYSWYEGEYNPIVPLKDEVANEVFISNVIGDPHVSQNVERVKKLLEESKRLLAKDGYIIVRETITPKHSLRILNEDFLSELGLNIVGVFSPQNTEKWEKLEEVYKAEPLDITPSDNSFYIVLSKTPDN